MKAKLLLGLSGAVTLAGVAGSPPELMLPIYALFVAAGFAREPIERAAARLRARGLGQFGTTLLSFWVAGSITELLAWAHNYRRADPHPALFHPQLLADLLIGLGFYGGWAVAWHWVLRRWRFDLWQGFVITGLQGIFFEQLGAVFLNMVRMFSVQPLLALLFGLYVFLVHGSAAGLGLLPGLRGYAAEAGPRGRPWWRIPVVMALMVGAAFAGSLLVGALAQLFGGLPPKRSIVEHPLW